MIDHEKIGKQIVLLRKEKGLTGEKLAELLSVSPQAISKWENGKCLPESSILPLLSKVLECSIDTILTPQKLQILSAIYTDGVTNIDITQIMNSLIRDNILSIVVNQQFIGHRIDTDRISSIILKYQIPQGTYFTYALENDTFLIDLNTKGYLPEDKCNIIGAYYGNRDDVKEVSAKLKHYDYYKWTEFYANHELFPSSTVTDNIEYLTLIYINTKGIYVVSCAENESICYTVDRAHMYSKNASDKKCILPDIIKLRWNNQMDCTWAGALYAALKSMGEDITYEYLMGVSGACYRIAFTDQWDFSSVDALVSYDYASTGYKALGYEIIWADRLEKGLRKEEREKIVSDINQCKPPIAINLRVAPEWGVITGYLENGKRLLCRTYFDGEVWKEHEAEPDFAKETGGYLESDMWPFLITHFGDKLEKPQDKENLFTSLQVKVESMNAPQNRGYHQGFEGYKSWINSLLEESNWMENTNKEGIDRRLAVNDYQLINLIDARRCATTYLKNSIHLVKEENSYKLLTVAKMYGDITDQLIGFREKVQMGENQEIEYNMRKVKAVSSSNARKEQAKILTQVLELEYKIDELVKEILEDE